MKLYLFFFKPNKVGDVPTLYSFTEKESLAKEFIKYRDDDKFIKKVIKFKEKEYIEFADKYSKLKLTESGFKTKSLDSNNLNKITTVKIVCTWKEEEFIYMKQDRIMDEYTSIFFDCSMFKDKYIKSLEKLLYFKLSKFYSNTGYDKSFLDPYYTPYGPEEDFLYEDLKESFNYDELSLFIKYFGYTMKK